MLRILSLVSLLALAAGAWGQPQPRTTTQDLSQPTYAPPLSATGGEKVTEDEKRLLDEAFQFFREQDYRKAAAVYDAITKKNPKLGIAWFRLGYSLHMTGKLEDAVAAHEKAAEFRLYKGTAYFNLGCAYALKGKKEIAFSYLEKAVDAGFRQLDYFENDPDLASLRDEPRFKSFLDRLKQTRPALLRELDFWVGEWQVADEKGQKIGHSAVKKSENGHLVTERFATTGGVTSTNFFYFDPSERKWKLTWVSSGGEIWRMCGAEAGVGLEFCGEHVSAEGKTRESRGRLEPQGGGKVKLTLGVASGGKNGVETSWQEQVQIYSPAAGRAKEANAAPPPQP